MLVEPRNALAQSASKSARVALVGNPNTGKTTLFNELTGYHQRVGNYPGVTVEKKTGRLASADGAARSIEIIDLPGAYGFSARSHDEMVVIDTLTGRGVDRRPDLVVMVVDAVNLRRNLFLTSQVLELGVPVVVALNMMDLAAARGIRIDSAVLSDALGVPVVPLVATKGRGIDALKRAIVAELGQNPPPRFPRMPPEIAGELEDLNSTLRTHRPESRINGMRCSPIELLQAVLEPDGFASERLRSELGSEFGEALGRCRTRLAAAGVDPAQVEAEARYAWIEGVLVRSVDAGQARVASASDVVDRFLTHPMVGPAVLLVIMGVVFQSIYAWAAPVMDFIESGFGVLGVGLGGLLPAGALQSLVVEGVLGGVGAVMVFLPQIMILFFFLAILEDCGYMARAASVLDRVMGLCGLNGKAFIPLVSSFACAVPGIMTTRTIENRADRFVTILVAPLMSCSARLPVYVLLIAAFIPARPLLGGLIGVQALVLLAMYMVGVVVAVAVAVFLRKVVFKGENRAFLMELPTYKWPSPKTVLYRVYERAREFVIRAGTIIFAVSILIWALAYYPRPAGIAEQFNRQRAAVEQNESGEAAQAELERLDRAEAGAYLRQSVLGRIGHAIEPFVRPLGWDWKIGTAVVASFPAREVIIATLGTIYNLGEDADEESADLRSALQAAKWPDGRLVFNVPVALSIMVFFALCMQCGGTLAVIKRETNSWRWPVITFTYMTTLAYLAALATYQVAIRLA